MLGHCPFVFMQLSYAILQGKNQLKLQITGIELS